jgi:hypothetical protein
VSYVPITSASVASTAAAVAAAARAAEEEEDLTKYGKEDLDGWEFKIVRTYTARFRDYAAVQRVCQEEARSGWELVEKFDDYRLRFKRRIEHRSNDHLQQVDPYRTQLRCGNTKAVLLAVGITAVVIGATVFFILMAQ